MGLGIDVQGIIGAPLHTGLTPDTPLWVEVNDTVFALPKGCDWTDICTGGIIAVIAPHDREVPARVGELSLLDVFDPGLIDPDWVTVLGFARHRTGMTTDTPPVVNHEAIFGNGCHLALFSLVAMGGAPYYKDVLFRQRYRQNKPEQIEFTSKGGR